MRCHCSFLLLHFPEDPRIHVIWGSSGNKKEWEVPFQNSFREACVMSVYVMSDIHGEADLFHAMLKQIRFSQNDTLYILGDVIDRGPDGIALLQEIMHTPNMVMLLGNHEDMMLRCCHKNVTALDCLRWSRNGNQSTVAAFRRLESREKRAMIEYLSALQTHVPITVGGFPTILYTDFHRKIRRMNYGSVRN